MKPFPSSFPAFGRWLCVPALLLSLTGGSGRALGQEANFDDLAREAAAARDQNQTSRAIDLYTQAEQLNPNWPDGWWNLGLLQYGANQYGNAVEAFSHLLALAPNAVPAMALRGLCEFELGAFAESARDLGTAVARGGANDPRNEQIIRYHLAQALTREGQFQGALDQYRVFAEHHVSSEELTVAVGLAAMRVQKLPGDVVPPERQLYAEVGAAGMAMLGGDTAQAEQLFQQLFAHYSTTPNLHLFYGFLLYPKDPALGAAQFRAELQGSPGNDAARALLAHTLMITGHYNDAIPEAERALRGTPRMEMAQVALGRSLAETGDSQRGTDLLNQVVEQDPSNLEAHMGLAAIYSRAGRREDAYRERMLCLALEDT